jgi:cytochrome c553
MLGAVVATLLLAAPAFAADPVAKPEKVVVCAACHQENGASKDGSYPNLAGQYANYIEHSLKAYRSGERKNAIMSAQAANLSDADIKQLALWYSTQTPVLYTPKPEADGK